MLMVFGPLTLHIMDLMYGLELIPVCSFNFLSFSLPLYLCGMVMVIVPLDIVLVIFVILGNASIPSQPGL